ncbi:MAG: TetR/AcrR family transcriptional regulator [Propionibacteriaceae bacterium]
MTGTGLREAKRAALARDLARITFEQVSRRGFAAVTVDDVVSEAGVSRRTFSNYYSCKEAAVAAVAVHRVGAALNAWHAPRTNGVVDLVRDLVAHQVDEGAMRALAEVAALGHGHPQLVPFVREAQWQVWAAVADRVLTALDDPDPATVQAVHAVVGALFGVVSTALVAGAQPAHQPSPGTLHSTVLQTLDLLERGVRSAAGPRLA